MEHAEQPDRLFVRLASDVLRDGPCDSYADLCDAIRWKAARLHIRYTEDQITAAAHFIVHARRLWRPTTQPVQPQPGANGGPSRGLAAAILSSLNITARRFPAPKEHELKTWTRTLRPIKCGHCKTAMPRGTVALELRGIDGWTLFRCAVCAVGVGDAPPADVPPLADDEPQTRTARIDAATRAAFDRLSRLDHGKDE